MRSKMPVKQKKKPRYLTRDIRAYKNGKAHSKNKSGFQSLSKKPEPSWKQRNFSEMDEFGRYKSNIREQKDKELREKKARLKQDLLCKYSKNPPQ